MASTFEHIIPEALGCPAGFALSGGTVCRECNNGLAHLDQAVIDDFDIFTYMNNVSRKRGRPTEIRNRGNMIGTKGPGRKEISINMDPRPVKAHDGSKLGGFGNSDRNISASFETDGRIAKLSFDVSLGNKPKFTRGLVKIAFSSLAYFCGGTVALSTDFDPVRSFVRHGIGNRKVMMMPSIRGGYRNQVWPPYRSSTGEYAVTFRLVVLEFCVDLSPNMVLFPMLKHKAMEMYGKSGWTYLPPDV